MEKSEKIEIYDTTLRDGTQQSGINLSLEEKILITKKLDELGVDFIEGGFAGSNPKDEEYFKRVKNLELKKVFLNDIELKKTQYEIDDYKLKILNVPKKFILTTYVRIKPHKNTELEGLYKSGSIFCTPCESEGFRKITFFLDRPDVMSIMKQQFLLMKNFTQYCFLMGI